MFSQWQFQVTPQKVTGSIEGSLCCVSWMTSLHYCSCINWHFLRTVKDETILSPYIHALLSVCQDVCKYLVSFYSWHSSSCMLLTHFHYHFPCRLCLPLGISIDTQNWKCFCCLKAVKLLIKIFHWIYQIIFYADHSLLLLINEY